MRLELADVGAVAEPVGRRAGGEVTVEAPALGRSLFNEVGGLRGVVVGRFGGMLPLTGGLFKAPVPVRVFSGDFGPSAEEGLEAPAAGFSEGAMTALSNIDVLPESGRLCFLYELCALAARVPEMFGQLKETMETWGENATLKQLR